MAYTKQIWKKGDIVTPARLNHMEDGIEAAHNGTSVGVIIDTNGTLDKNYNEIIEMIANYDFVIIRSYDENDSILGVYFVMNVEEMSSRYYVSTNDSGVTFVSDSATGTMAMAAVN